MNVRFLLPVLLLGLAGCTSGPSGPTDAATDPAPSSAMAESIAVGLADFVIDPAAYQVDGPTLTFEVTNEGPTLHNFTVRDGDDQVVVATSDLAVGARETISADLEPGDYTVYCSLAGHESLGMTGTMTVDD